MQENQLDTQGESMETEASPKGNPKAITDLRDAVNMGTVKLFLLIFITGGFWSLVYMRDLYAHMEAVAGAPMNLKKGWREGWLGKGDWSKPDIAIIVIACIWFVVTPSAELYADVMDGHYALPAALSAAAWATLVLWVSAVALAIRQYTEREFGFNFPLNWFAVVFFHVVYLNYRINKMAESYEALRNLAQLTKDAPKAD